MTTTEQDIHAALMARVETFTDLPLIWPRKGDDMPAGEHVRVAHVPNDNERMFQGGVDEVARRGFIVLTLVSPLGEYEVNSRAQAQTIADVFPRNYQFERGGFKAIVYDVTVKPGRQEGQRWETPIWVDYRGFA